MLGYWCIKGDWLPARRQKRRTGERTAEGLAAGIQA